MKYAWEFERSIHSVRLMADFALSNQITYQHILQGTGLDQQQLLDPNTMVSGQQELQLICNLVAHLPDRATLGLDVGTCYHFTAFGSLGMALMSSANIREALGLALNYFQLTFLFTGFSASERDDGVYIYFQEHGLPDQARQFIIQRDMSALITVQRDLVPENFCQRVGFSFQPSGNVRHYEHVFGVVPEFGASQNYIVIDHQKTDSKLQMANQLVLHSAEQQCRQILQQRQIAKQYTALVQQQLMQGHGGMLSMQLIAEKMHVNPRTLRRYLAQEGTTFIRIREDVRQILAAQYLLLPHLSIEQIAEWLGYAETASFIHAYKRWYGQTPHAARLSHRR